MGILMIGPAGRIARSRQVGSPKAPHGNPGAGLPMSDLSAASPGRGIRCDARPLSSVRIRTDSHVDSESRRAMLFVDNMALPRAASC